VNRRTFVSNLGLTILATPLVAQAQPVGKLPLVGRLLSVPTRPRSLEIFQDGLRELGWVNGHNVIIETRDAEGKLDRLPQLSAELVRRGVAVIVAVGSESAAAARRESGTIPIVMMVAGDPVRLGLVQTLARPGGNVTGLSLLAEEIQGKRLELLRETVPRLSRVAVVMDPRNEFNRRGLTDIAAAARRLGVVVQALEVQKPGDLAGAFARASKARADGILGEPAPWIDNETPQLVTLALRYRLPAIYWVRSYAEAGGLMSYGPDLLAVTRRAAWYVDRILRGAKPAELPVEQPTKLELVINLRTAKSLGLTIPQSILLRADEVIQ
jgi:putative ABC transport system substrate-binding protein